MIASPEPTPATRFRRLLVATDFGPHSAAALDAALSLAPRFDAELMILHVFQLPILVETSEIYTPLAALAAKAGIHLDQLAEAARARHPKVERLVVEGSPADRILDVIAEYRADLVVLGTHGRTGIGRVVLGSVAARVLRLCAVPLLTLHAPAAGAAAP